MNTKETILWGVKVGDEDWQEQIITTDENQIEAAKEWASNNGFDRFRVAKIDLGVKPDFVSTLNIFEMGGNVNNNVTSDFKEYVQNHSKKESFLYNNRLFGSRLITSKQYEMNRDFIIKNKSEDNKMFKRGGVVGQEIVFDDGGEENTGVIQEVNEITGDYIVDTDDGRTVLAQHDIDVISLGEMRKKPRDASRKKLFGLFEDGGNISPKKMYIVTNGKDKGIIISAKDADDAKRLGNRTFYNNYPASMIGNKLESLNIVQVYEKGKNLFNSVNGSKTFDKVQFHFSGESGAGVQTLYNSSIDSNLDDDQLEFVGKSKVDYIKFFNGTRYEQGGSVDNKFDYMMLSRLQSDNDAYLYGSRNESQLWAGNVKDQIDEMKTIWNRLKVKPEWLSMQDILDYEEKMTNKFAKGGNVKTAKIGDILTASTGVELKVVDYDPLFGGRVKVIRMDEYSDGTISQWMPLSKFNSSSKMAKGGSVDSNLKDSTYIPNRDIVSITIKKDGKNVKLTAKDILDGIYYKGVSSESFFKVGDSIIYPYTNDSKLDDYTKKIHNENADKELVIEKIIKDKPFDKAIVTLKSTGEKVRQEIILNPNYLRHKTPLDTDIYYFSEKEKNDLEKIKLSESFKKLGLMPGINYVFVDKKLNKILFDFSKQTGIKNSFSEVVNSSVIKYLKPYIEEEKSKIKSSVKDESNTLPTSKVYGYNLYKAIQKFGISESEARSKYGNYTIKQWDDLLNSSLEKSIKDAKTSIDFFTDGDIGMKYIKNNKFDAKYFESSMQERLNKSKLGRAESLIKIWSKELGMNPSKYIDGLIVEDIDFIKDSTERAKYLFSIIVKIKVNGLNGWMPGIDYVYYDKVTKKYFFNSTDNEILELKNDNTLAELQKFLKKSTTKMAKGGELSDYSNQTGIKSSLLKDIEFTHLLLPEEKQFINKTETKIFKKRTAIYFTDGKKEVVFSITKPFSKLKKLGNASNIIKEVYSKEIMEKGGKTSFTGWKHKMK